MNENFINTWVPNSELGRVPSLRDPIAKRRERESKSFDTTHALAQAIMKGWQEHSPVDAFVISPEFELMGRQAINEIRWPMQQFYLTFLQESLDGKLPGFGEGTSEPELLNLDTTFSSLNVVLNDVQTSQETMSIFRTPAQGYQDYTVVEIDTTAFENGGVLTVDISVGLAAPSGSFDLYHGDSELPTEGMPHEALASAWDIPPGKKGTITHHFNRGTVFKLGATGSWFSEQGSINAFLAKISVEPNRKPEPRKMSSARPGGSAEDVMNAFVEAFKNLEAEVILSMLTEDARETFGDNFQDVPEDVHTQMSQVLSQMEVLSSQYVGDEFHFRLRVPIAQPPEMSVKMRKVEGIWRIYDFSRSSD